VKREKLKAWLGVFMVAWPILKFAVQHLTGIPLPDLDGFGDILAIGSQSAGTALLATSEPITKTSDPYA
jgi:hypothetical protein